MKRLMIRLGEALAFLAMFVLCDPALAASPRVGHVSVGTSTPVEIGDAASRISLSWFNSDGTNPIYCGGATVTSSTGDKLPAGQGFTVDQPAPAGRPYPASYSVYCIATGGTVTVTFRESVY